MTLSSSDVRPYVGSGLTDADIHAELSALTVSAISIAELENFFDFEQLAKRNPITGAWEGVLIDRLNLGGALGEGLAELFSHVNKPRSEQVNTNEIEWAVKAADLLVGLQAVGDITADQASGFVALGGGYKHDGIVVQDVTDAFVLMDEEDAAKAQAEADASEAAAKREEINQFWARFNAKYNEHVLPVLEGGAAVGDAAVVSGLQSLVDNWNA